MSILAKGDASQSVEDICLTHQISPATFYKWKKEAADNKTSKTRSGIQKIFFVFIVVSPKNKIHEAHVEIALKLDYEKVLEAEEMT